MKDDSRYLQISAPVQSGNSGGPLLDQSGNLVGVVSAKLDAIKVAMASNDLPQNVNFAVKAAMVAAFLDANRVTYKVGAPGDKPIAPADIADQARAMSGFVVCR
jgi:serine protease Do